MSRIGEVKKILTKDRPMIYSHKKWVIVIAKEIDQLYSKPLEGEVSGSQEGVTIES